jgi:glycosyltransferase 2 family protein
VLTTACSAWRWSLIARGLGVRVPMGAAIAAYYRSQFLNTTLPGGVLGDVHRGVSHGREVGDVGRGLRAVAWERSAGQVVQIALAVIVLLLLPSPVQSHMPVVAVGIAVGIIAVAVTVILLTYALPQRLSIRWRQSRGSRVVHAAAADVRDGLLAGRAWPGIAFASLVVVAGHTMTFLLAARTAGSTAPLVEMLPLTLVVLLAMAVPINIGGWGPREGVAAWAFSAAGLGAAQGVATAVVYGVMALVATMPGAVVLVVVWLRRNGRRHGVAGGSPRQVPAPHAPAPRDRVPPAALGRLAVPVGASPDGAADD